MLSRSARAGWLLAAALAAGCAAPTPDPGLPPPPSQAARSAFGSVAVVVVPRSTRGAEDLPSGGALEGAGSAAGNWMDIAGRTGEGSGLAAGGLMLLSPLVALGGAAMGPSREETERATAVVGPILGDEAAADVFAARFTVAADSLAGVRCVAATDASTVVRLRVDRVELRSRPGRSMVTANLAVAVTGNARVVRASDGSVVHDAALSCGNPGVVLTLGEWAADDGRRLRAEIDAALTRVAAALAEEIFLVDRTLAELAAPPAHYGLVREPVRDVSHDRLFRWEGFAVPAAWTSDPAACPGAVVRVTYDFRVFGAHGDVQFERDGVTVPEQLVPGSSADAWKQLWTVRARVETERGVRLGPWSQLALDEIAGRSPTVPPSARALSGLYVEW